MLQPGWDTGTERFPHLWFKNTSVIKLEQYLKLEFMPYSPIGFGHRGSYCIRAQMVPLLIRHRWSLAFGHKWSHCIRAYMFYWIRTQRVLFYSGTDGPVAFGHRWSHCIRTYKFLLDPGTDGPFRNQAQMVLVHLGTDGPISLSHYGQNPPFLGYCLSSLKSFRQLKQCE